MLSWGGSRCRDYGRFPVVAVHLEALFRSSVVHHVASAARMQVQNRALLAKTPASEAIDLLSVGAHLSLTDALMDEKSEFGSLERRFSTEFTQISVHPSQY